MVQSLRLAAVAAVAVLLLCAPVDADNAEDRTRMAVESGEVMPLKSVLKVVRGQVEGEVLDAQLVEESGGWMYWVRVLAPDGRVLDIGVDGESGQIVTIDGGG